MTNEEVGIYIKLLCFQWEYSSLPSSPKDLQRLVGTRKPISPRVMSKFALGDDNLYRNLRLEQELAKQKEFRKTRAENALKGWSSEEKRDARASKVHIENRCINDALQSSSSSPSSDIKTPIAPTPNLEAKIDPQREALRLRLYSWFNRRPGTPMSPKEQKLFKSFDPDPWDLDLLEDLYTALIPKGEDYRRRDIATFLGNWPGELDRARKFQAGSKPSVKAIPVDAALPDRRTLEEIDNTERNGTCQTH